MAFNADTPAQQHVSSWSTVTGARDRPGWRATATADIDFPCVHDIQKSGIGSILQKAGKAKEQSETPASIGSPIFSHRSERKGAGVEPDSAKAHQEGHVTSSAISRASADSCAHY